MATINGKPVNTTLRPKVTKAFAYDEVTAPPRYEMELLGAKVKRVTRRFKVGHTVPCKTWEDFETLHALAQQYGGEVLFV